MKLDWLQIKILQDAFESLLNNEFMSDIKYKFPDGAIIFAHSFVLCCRSGEFYNTFQGTIGVSKLILVPDYSYDEFYEFLKYLYTDSCEITGMTAGGIMQLAEKYSLLELQNKCLKPLMTAMNESNACAVLEKSLETDCQQVKEAAIDFIAKNYLTTLNDKSFLKIKDTTLQTILNLEPVSDVDEFKIFEMTRKWAIHACFAAGKQPSGKLKRSKLDNNIKLIRFGAMSEKEFRKCVELEPGLLTNNEIASIDNCITSAGKSNNCEFSNKKRLQLPQAEIDSVLFETIWRPAPLQCLQFQASFSVSHAITIEQIVVNNEKGAEKFCLMQAKEVIDLKRKTLLEPNLRYTVIVNYLTKTRMSYIPDEIKVTSRSGNAVFTLHAGASPCIKELLFKL